MRKKTHKGHRRQFLGDGRRGEEGARPDEEGVESLLSGRYEPEKAKELATLLTEGRWTHDYPITYEEAKRLGLHVKVGIPQGIYQLMSPYPQPIRRERSVEYTPVYRYRGKTGKSRNERKMPTHTKIEKRKL